MVVSFNGSSIYNPCSHWNYMSHEWQSLFLAVNLHELEIQIEHSNRKNLRRLENDDTSSHTQGWKKCGNHEGASWEIVHARGKLTSCKSSKIK